MRSFSTGDLVRKIGDVTHAASQAPVTITHHNKPRYILMSIEAFQSMQSKNPQRSFRVEDTPDDVAEWLLPALDRIANGDFADEQ